MALENGTYRIVNVKYKNSVLAHNVPGCDLVLSADPRGETPPQDKRWQLKIFENGNFTIKNAGYTHTASCDFPPEANKPIVGGLLGRSEQQWIIKERKIRGQFTISPTDDSWLFWNMPNNDLDSPITLQDKYGDPRSHWMFVPCSVQPDDAGNTCTTSPLAKSDSTPKFEHEDTPAQCRPAPEGQLQPGAAPASAPTVLNPSHASYRKAILKPEVPVPPVSGVASPTAATSKAAPGQDPVGGTQPSSVAQRPPYCAAVKSHPIPSYPIPSYPAAPIPQIRARPSLKSGTYTIVNVRYKTSVLGDTVSGSDLASTLGRPRCKPVEDERWTVRQFQNGHYTIKNVGCAHYASCALRAKPNDPIVNGGIRRQTPQQWVVKETDVPGHFTISPTHWAHPKALFWNVSSHALFASITLREGTSDSGSHWIFEEIKTPPPHAQATPGESAPKSGPDPDAASGQLRPVRVEAAPEDLEDDESVDGEMFSYSYWRAGVVRENELREAESRRN
ncbi:hypothetical protein FB45DRAFT_945857 [Roridomyces roridus]|uniref:Ricin B lectin domain-containing protein n=1 Tax=Roridomyces roridus TaxID=1738132 RepID=A0AAD7B2H1_9AGAR|nr:hypothetical protein FB45DRAFT_945857 [Roridomyces roridus]